MYPIRHFYYDTTTRRVANHSQRGTFSPWGKTGFAGHQPSISMSWGYSWLWISLTLSGTYEFEYQAVLERLESLEIENKKIKEELEDSKNRGIKKMLILRNIQHDHRKESWNQTNIIY